MAMAIPNDLLTDLKMKISTPLESRGDLLPNVSSVEYAITANGNLAKGHMPGRIAIEPSAMEATTADFQRNANFSESAQLLCGDSEGRTVSIAEVIACFISLVTVIENLAILTAIIRGPSSLRKPPYWFIASLAVADLLTGLEVVLAIFVPVGTSPNSRIVLKGLAVVTFIVSINSLLLVSFDRYLRIAHHTDYDRVLTRQWIVFLIVLAWLVSFVVFLMAPLLGWSCAEQHCCADNGVCTCKREEFGESVCSGVCSQSFVPFQKSYIITGVMYFLAAIAAMTVFYSLLFQVVKKKTFGNSRSSSSTSVDSKAKKREVQLTKTLMITLGVFVLCWMPVMALFVADFVITYKTAQLAKVFDYALVPSVINSFLNPIIYSVRLPRMRQTIQRIILPCIYGRSGQSRLGNTWATNTSFDRSMRRKGTRKQIWKLKVSEDSSNGSSRSRNTRSRLASNKSLNSEMSLSRDSMLN